MKAVIIDDERFVREDLKRLLQDHHDIEIIGEAGTVPRARDLLGKTLPDVVFLDVQLVGGSGFDLVEAVPPGAHIIFFTAHDEFAVRAFDVNALDYLLKPVDKERLDTSLDRLRRAGGTSDNMPQAGRLLRKTDKVLIRSDGKQRFVSVQDITAVDSIGGNYTRVHLFNGRRLAARRTMKQWADILPERVFFRIHRSCIINLDHLESVSRNENSDIEARMVNTTAPFIVSRRCLSGLKEHTRVRA